LSPDVSIELSFDPYHKWLGIPPEHQPPDHYRLLGLDRFAADSEVIRAAAEPWIPILTVGTAANCRSGPKHPFVECLCLGRWLLCSYLRVFPPRRRKLLDPLSPQAFLGRLARLLDW
jgi:hypothetical protein